MYSGVTAHPQKEKAIRVPVTMAPSAPASDLRGAIGRKRKLRGSLGVYRPQARPTVDAAVSHQDKLRDGDKNGSNRVREGVETYMRIETTATSRG
jgi:hypothetical protein